MRAVIVARLLFVPLLERLKRWLPILFLILLLLSVLGTFSSHALLELIVGVLASACVATAPALTMPFFPRSRLFRPLLCKHSIQVCLELTERVLTISSAFRPTTPAKELLLHALIVVGIWILTARIPAVVERVFVALSISVRGLPIELFRLTMLLLFIVLLRVVVLFVMMEWVLSLALMVAEAVKVAVGLLLPSVASLAMLLAARAMLIL